MVQCPAGKLAGQFMRFTIRDVIWLTVVVALGIGWWRDRNAVRANTIREVKDWWIDHVEREHRSDPATTNG